MLVDNISEWYYITLIYTTDCNSWTIRWSMLTKRMWRKEKTANLVSSRKAELYNCRLWKRLTTDLIWYYRSSYLEVFCRKGTLKKFREIHRKTPVPEPLFNKVAGLRPATLLKKGPWHRCFLVNFAKFLRTTFLQNTSGRLLFQISQNTENKKPSNLLHIETLRQQFQ